ncbi:MAG: NADH-quinone oxidoreductase subunit N [Thermoanaerobaculia bacterium]
MTLTPLIEPNWFTAILPELILIVAGMALILFEAFAPRLRSSFSSIAILALIAAGASEFFVPAGTYFGGMYQLSGLTRIFDFTFLLAALLAALLSTDYLAREKGDAGEYYALLVWGTVGMMMMAKGLDLLVVVIGLEMLSICIFVLVGFNRRTTISNEASLKYFLMGAFATGFILYGTAFFYGASGSTRVSEIATALAAAEKNPLLTIAFVMIIAGFGFKLALAPFHGWAPDVYQGAPTPIAAWLSVAPKAATLIALLRILAGIMPSVDRFEWGGLLAVLSIASMILGNLVAIAQRDLKRMLAYSGIAHVGYMMIAVLSPSENAIAAVAVYTIVYALMNIGAFGVVALINKDQNEPQTINDIAGLGFRKPFIGLALAICMLSLAGIPPTAGFMSKVYVFKTAIEAGNVTIAFIGILASIVSVYYYLRVVYYLYMKEVDETLVLPTSGVFSTGALAISIIGILLIGLLPAPLFETALRAAATLLQN